MVVNQTYHNIPIENMVNVLSVSNLHGKNMYLNQNINIIKNIIQSIIIFISQNS